MGKRKRKRRSRITSLRRVYIQVHAKEPDVLAAQVYLAARRVAHFPRPLGQDLPLRFIALCGALAEVAPARFSQLVAPALRRAGL